MGKYILKVVAAVVAMVIIAATASSTLALMAEKDESLRRGEKRVTLAPDIFASNPRIKAAYQVAKEIPWVLDSIYCYCLCEESPVFKHKSLLSCYVDNHAAM